MHLHPTCMSLNLYKWLFANERDSFIVHTQVIQCQRQLILVMLVLKVKLIPSLPWHSHIFFHSDDLAF